MRLAETNQTNSEHPQRIVSCVSNFDATKTALAHISNRTTNKSQSEAQRIVEQILKKVLAEGDQALIEYTEKFDGFKPKSLTIPNGEIIKAWEKLPLKLQDALMLAHERIKNFHKLQKPENITLKGSFGETLCRQWSPVQKAGIYIPGGRASYPSTVLMNAIPAKVAGVKEIVMVSPCNKFGEINNVVLAAAHLSGIKTIFSIGGAQAIGALAYGTETIPKVDVISGPGNLYVTLAKKAVYGQVGIDSLAGPSEVLIIADQTANSKQVATDLLAQAEHDPLAASILLTTNKQLAEEIPKELDAQLNNHPREEICRTSLKNWGLIAICDTLESCIELSDGFAPEHLELLVDNPHRLTKLINNAGAIFLGEWTPEAVGDYLAGPNHTLPTSGAARFSSALCVETFMKNTSLIEFNEQALKNTKKAVIELANSEGLYSHSESIRIRSKKLK